MTDHRLRDLERRARQGDPLAGAAYQAALERLRLDPALDQAWCDVVEALERLNRRAGRRRRLEVDALALAVRAACEAGEVACAWAPGAPPSGDATVRVRALVARVRDAVTLTIAPFTPRGANGWATDRDVEPFAEVGSITTVRLPDPRGCGVLECCGDLAGFEATLLGERSSQEAIETWAEATCPPRLPVQDRPDVGIVRLRLDRDLAVRWAAQALER